MSDDRLFHHSSVRAQSSCGGLLVKPREVAVPRHICSENRSKPTFHGRTSKLKSLCYVIPYVDFTRMQYALNRIHTFLSEGYQVDIILYKGSYLSQFRSVCGSKINYCYQINDDQLDTTLNFVNVPFLLSWEILRLLKKSSYDRIVFNDEVGPGFHCIQAKKAGLHFKDTLLVVDRVECSQAFNEIAYQWGSGGIGQLMLEYMERYNTEFCDALITPSKAMITWMLQHKWQLCGNHFVMPFSILENYAGKSYRPEKNDRIALIFVGKLERQNGLHIFLEAVHQIYKLNQGAQIEKVLFAGETGLIDHESSNAYIAKTMNAVKIKFEVIAPMTSQELLEAAEKQNAVLLYANAGGVNCEDILNVAYYDYPVIASDTPAHRELFNEECLFSLEANKLADAIIKKQFAKLRPDAFEQDPPIAIIEPGIRRLHIEKEPLVSICTAYYNHHEYIPMLLESIEELDYKNLEWIVVDDCSSDPASVALIKQYSEIYKERPYRFVFLDENSGPSVARNHAVSLAHGKYIVFADADNILKPNIIKTFAYAMEYSGYDALSCFCDVFEGDVKPEICNKTLAYLGACLEIGLFSNVFGDTNFIIKREVFEETNGFEPKRVIFEDWTKLVSLALMGYKVDVIPQALFWYRESSAGNNSFGSDYNKQRMIFDTFCKELPPYLYHLINSFCRPTFEVAQDSEIAQFSIRLCKLIKKWAPMNSRRRRMLKRIFTRPSDGLHPWSL